MMKELFDEIRMLRVALDLAVDKLNSRIYPEFYKVEFFEHWARRQITKEIEKNMYSLIVEVEKEK